MKLVINRKSFLYDALGCKFTSGAYNHKKLTKGSTVKKLNAKSFGLVEGLLIVITLSLVVGVGFYVVNSSKDKKQDSSAVSTQPTSDKSKLEDKTKSTKKPLDPTASWQTYDSQYYSFKYPAEWKHIPEKSHPTQPDEFTSPDYTEEDGQKTGLYNSVAAGAKLGVRTEQSQGSLNNYASGTNPQREIKVDGQLAIQSDVEYELQTFTQTVFQKNSLTYVITLHYPKDSKAKNIDAYNKIVESFRTK